MTVVHPNPDPMRRPGNSLLAAGVLIAAICVLVGFHGVTMVLSAFSLSADRRATVEAPVAATAAVAPSKPAATPPAEAQQAAAPAVQPALPAAGVAAAARAKARAEMDRMEPELESPRERRRFRAPRPELHRVY